MGRRKKTSLAKKIRFHYSLVKIFCNPTQVKRWILLIASPNHYCTVYSKLSRGDFFGKSDPGIKPVFYTEKSHLRPVRSRSETPKKVATKAGNVIATNYSVLGTRHKNCCLSHFRYMTGDISAGVDIS